MSEEHQNMDTDAAAATAAEDDRKLFVGGLPQDAKDTVSKISYLATFHMK